ncbi:MAG TPA: glycosyltransferase, partial [Acidobacteriota bacterium]|nr:glycosyltransferase [Acidobacteriota bacterium]
MVDLDRFRPDPDGRRRMRAALAIGADDPVLLFSGRLVERKNLGFLLRVARRLADRRPNLHLLLCGDGECRPALQAQAREAGLETVVRFMGRLPNERLPEVLAAADVFVLPSLAEGLSIALLEALACGVPAVCSNVGDLAQAVASGENGYVVGNYDVDAYADRIEDVLRDHARFSRQARESVRRYDAGAITRQIEEILVRVARLPRARHRY